MQQLSSLTNRYFIVFFGIIIAWSFLIRVWGLTTPKGYMFDEVYHALTAKLIARGDERAYEWWHGDTIEPNTAIDWLHPPLAKLFQASSIRIFGENEFGWRISSVVFGTMVTALVIHFAKEIWHSKSLALLAGFLYSLDGLGIAMSRIAMNDIHVTFFILLSAWLLYRMYQHAIGSREWKRYSILTGIAFGLALASKWSGFFVLPAFVTFHIYHSLKHRKISVSNVVVLTLTWLVIPIAVYLLSFGQMWLQGKGWEHFSELNNQIWRYQTTLEATHPYQSTPVEWMLNMRPVWMYVSYQETGQVANVYAQGNTILMWSGLVVVGVLILRSLIHKQSLSLTENKHALQISIRLQPFSYPLFYLVFWYLIVWLPWILSPRIMFFYHYTPALPFLSILVAFSLAWLWKKGDGLRYVALAVGAAIVLNFIIFYPNWTAINVPPSLHQSWYQLFESWK